MDFVALMISVFTQHWFTVGIACTVTIALYLLGTWHSRQLKPFSHLPGPKPWPFINNLPDAVKSKGQLHVQLDGYYKKYGKLFVMSGVKEATFCVSDPEMIKQILVKDFDSFIERQSLLEFPKPLDSMLSTATTETWRRLRNTLSPTFSGHKIKRMVPLVNKACDTFLEKLKTAAHKEGSLDIFKCVYTLTFDVIMSTAFGIQSECQTNPDDPVMAEARDSLKLSPVAMAIIGLGTLVPYGTNLVNLITPWLFKNFRGITRVAELMIETAKAKGTYKDENLLDLMLSAGSPDTTSQGKKLTDDEIAAQCIAFLLGGYETTSTTLSLTCYFLAINPAVQKRLQQEIDSVWPSDDSLPSYETVHGLPYLDMVISETLRLYPAVPFVSRVCTKRCEVKGLSIPKGANILVPVFSIHRDPSIWPDPQNYDPNRFSPEAKQSRDPYEYLPFGGGPRNCIGMRFAQMEMKLVLARILKKYSFGVTVDTPIPPTVKGLTLTIDGGIKLNVEFRL